jgi:hypothetical protein
MGMNAGLFLARKYGEMDMRTGDTEDLEIKKRTLKGLVWIPNYPAGKEPALWELEQQFLRDNGYNI